MERRGFFKRLVGMVSAPALPEGVERVRRYRPERGDTVVAHLEEGRVPSMDEMERVFESLSRAFPDCRVLVADGVREIGIYRPGRHPPPPTTPAREEGDRWWREALNDLEGPRGR